MAYIGWSTTVNKDILSSTSLTVGEGATVQDPLEKGGRVNSRLVCANPPDKFQVIMNFSMAEESRDENGLTEIDRFWSWFKWVHKYGVNPFEFPVILINTNRHNGLSTEERNYLAARKNNENPSVPPVFTEDNVTKKEFYKITSAANGSQIGTDMQVTMVWETVATGIISIPDEEVTIDHVIAENGFVDIFFTAKLSTTPTKYSYTATIKKDNENEENLSINNSVFDGDKCLRYFFTKRHENGNYLVKVGLIESPVFSVVQE